jgi:chemotaxis methyl-accepting protein methylase
MLIGVTSFFRDPEVFAFLKQNVLPDLIGRSPTVQP